MTVSRCHPLPGVRWGLIVLCLLGALAPAARAEPARAIPRTIITLYDGRLGPWYETVLHRMAEMPLNHLGLVVEPHDAMQPLPSLDGRADVRGILTWWQGDTMPDAAAFLPWAGAALDGGKRLVILGNPGLSGVAAAAADRLLRKLGLRLRPASYDRSYTARATVKAPDMVEFERRLPEGLALSGAAIRIDPEAKLYLQARQPGVPEPADLVVTTRGGGYAAEGFTHVLEEETGFRQWYLDPFAFLREAFATDDLPKPDVTTAVGRRLFFSQIDGDGWRSLTEVQPWRGRGARAIDVLIDAVFKGFPDLPVTLAPIAGDLDPAWCGDAPAQDAARRAFALPNVEPATHTYSHPFTWRAYEKGQPSNEAVGRVFCGGAPAAGYADLPGAEEDPALPTLGSRRAYPKVPFDLALEYGGSARFIGRFLPPGRCVRLVQWSGDSIPFPAAIRAADEGGFLNINGGDARFDRLFRSASWVAPIARQTRGGRQIYAAASNENTYTKNWTAAYAGYAALPETLERTESPRRLLPIDLYYHAYSGEKTAALNALLGNLRYAESREIAPVATTAYVGIAQGFFSTRIVPEGERAWHIEGRGALQTIRFDAAAGESLDFERSRGVLGSRRHEGSLYIALDPADPAPLVALKPGEDKPGRPALVQSRWLIDAFAQDGDAFTFNARGFGPGEMAWSVAPGRYEVLALTAAGPVRQEAEARADGLLAIRIPAIGPAAASVRVARLTEGDAPRMPWNPPLPAAPGQKAASCPP